MYSFAAIACSLCLVVLAYMCGSIPWGLLIARVRGVDLRKHGSQNIGATNVTRVIGREWGMLCFVMDFLKGLLPVMVGMHLSVVLDPSRGLLPILCGCAAIAGHIWPVWLHFRGGKGVATTIGAAIALAPWSVVSALVTWYVIFRLSRYVSLASLCASAMLPLSALGERFFCGDRPSTSIIVFLAVLCGVIVSRHRANVGRLMKGTEYRFGAGPKTGST